MVTWELIVKCANCSKKIHRTTMNRKDQRFCSHRCYALSKPLIPELDRFWSRVDKHGSTECWPWTGFCNNGEGYGHFSHTSGAKIHSHRYSWILHNGPIPDGLWVLHRCDNRPCVNPAHLFLGTHAENMADKIAKGRQAKQKGEAHGNSKLTVQAIIEIRDTRIPKKRLASKFNISTHYVNQIRRRVRWVHV